MPATTTVTYAFPPEFAGAPRLVLSVERCAVVVVGAAPGELSGIELVGRHLGQCPLQFSKRMRRSAEALHLHLDEDEGHVEQLVLRVPRDIALWVESDLGPVTVRDLAGCYLSVESEVGPVTLERVAGHLHISTEEGPVRGEDISGRLQIDTEVGPVFLQVRSLEPGEHQVETEVGPLNLELAPGIALSIRAGSESGPVAVDYPVTPAAPIRLQVTSEASPVHIGTWRRAPVAAAAESRASAPPPGAAAETRRILQMVQDGVLTAAEANELLHALE